MKFLRPLLLSSMCLVFATLSFAQEKEDHSAHHPSASASASSAASAAAAAKPASKPAAGMSKDGMAGMEAKMKTMHDKMMAAKTADERKALMAEHMKTMQDGMVMMNDMKKSDGANKPKMMEKRIDMMENMMQMMMDRMTAMDK